MGSPIRIQIYKPKGSNSASIELPTIGGIPCSKVSLSLEQIYQLADILRFVAGTSNNADIVVGQLVGYAGDPSDAVDGA